MREQTNGSYMRLLTEWQVRRELVNTYHRALGLLAQFRGVAPQRQQELQEKLVSALIALRQASEQLRRYEQGRAESDRF